MSLSKEAVEKTVGFQPEDVQAVMHDFKAEISQVVIDPKDEVRREIPVKRLGKVSGISRIWPEDY